MSGWPRGPVNELHCAAEDGSTERTVALLSEGLINIDQGDPEGATPLMYCCINGYVRVARILLREGANASIAALHFSAKYGHVAVTKLLVKAGAELEASTGKNGFLTPLHLCSEQGHVGAMTALIEAGANPDSMPGRETPLMRAAFGGHVDAVKVLLRAKANPLLATPTEPACNRLPYVPLDLTAIYGQADVLRELIYQLGIQGCGGESGGVQALLLVAGRISPRCTDMLGMLTDAGVVDTGQALCEAAGSGNAGAVKFLLQQQQPKEVREANGEVAYVNARFGFPAGTPLFAALSYGGWEGSRSYPRVIRLLADAGADTTSALQLIDREGEVVIDDTPLGFTTRVLREKKVGSREATEEQLHRMEATLRVLANVEAIHALSWLWPSDVPFITKVCATGAKRSKEASTAGTPLKLMLSILRVRAVVRGLLLAPMFRYSAKPWEGPEAGL